MRLTLMSLFLFSAGSIFAAAYTSKTVENYFAYANVISRSYAEGDANDASGWRECTEMLNSGSEVGMFCEGVRTILVHNGKRVDVNYYCEFRFVKVDTYRYSVEMEICQ
jgi:hypothetical protein